MKTISKENIHLLTSSTLVEMIKRIENYCPGWWWSVSQSPGNITLSLGPSRNSPTAVDVAFSRTRDGDAGLINSFCFETGDSESEFLVGIIQVFRQIDYYRRLISEKGLDPSLVQENSYYRKQSVEDLISLKNIYDVFLKEVPLLESRQHCLKEVYLGSCDLSVDCSLRGMKLDKTPFDISIDLKGIDSILANSLEISLVELKNEILTPCI